MSTNLPPEFPYPFPPDRQAPPNGPPPGTATPPAVTVPLVDRPSDDPAQRLFERRKVLVGGVLDHGAVNRLAAELMALDGRSADDVEVVINGPGGPLGEVGALLDVLELMRAAVNTTCTGRAEGTAAVLLACGTGRRRAGPHATVSLRCRHVESIEGSSSELTRRVEQLAAARTLVVAALARATGRPEGELADELDGGGSYDARGAVERGLVDEVTHAEP